MKGDTYRHCLRLHPGVPEEIIFTMYHPKVTGASRTTEQANEEFDLRRQGSTRVCHVCENLFWPEDKLAPLMNQTCPNCKKEN